MFKFFFLPVPKVRVKVRRYEVTGETSFPTESALAEVFERCPVSLSQLMFFRLKQSFLHESEGLSASPGSNICLWHIEVELRKGNKKCKTYFSWGAWDKTSKCGGGGIKVERDPFFAGGPGGSHNFNMRSGVRSAVMALIPCLMVGVSTLKGQSLCVSLETPSHRVKL